MSFSIGIASYFNAALYLLTVLFPVGMIAWNSIRKNKFALRCVLSALCMLIVIELFTFAVQYIYAYVPVLQSGIIYIQLIKFFVVFLLSGAAVKICFVCDWWGALFCATAGYCLQHISAKTDSIINEFLLPELHWAFSSFISLIIAAAVYIVFYFICLHKKRTRLDVANKWQVAIASCVVGVNIFYNSFGMSYLASIIRTLEIASLDTSNTDALLLFIYIMSMITALLALALDLGMSKNERLSGEMQELKHLLDESKRQYEYEKLNIEMINVKCHDLKHQLAAMKGKIYEEQIDELQNAIEIYDSSIKTGNEALDVVLTQKNFYCNQHGIRLTCLINGENYGFIKRHELYALFNNAIDNAIEAVEKIPEEKRVISITEQVGVGFVSVRVQNYFDGNAKFIDGLPVSGKGSKEHGYGMKSIKLIAEKYGGCISVSCEGDSFNLDIFFHK